MSFQVNYHTERTKLDIELKQLHTSRSGNYPILSLDNGTEGLTIFPTMEQLEDLHNKIGEFLKTQEVTK